MGYYDCFELKKANFKFKVMVCSSFPSLSQKCYFAWGDSEKPMHGLTDAMKSREYIVCLFPKKGVSIVWDYHRHRQFQHCGAAQESLSAGISWEEISRTMRSFPHYKRMGQRKGSPYEKVYVVRICDWRFFFSHIDEFMHFNEFDVDSSGVLIGKRIPETETLPSDTEEKRKCYSSQKLQRKSEFRAQVLLAYNNECAICQCDIPELLQAAHLHGHEVADTDLSEDRAENGICLCANHHLMYDSDLIDLDLEKAEVIVRDERANALLPSSKIKQPHSATE